MSVSDICTVEKFYFYSQKLLNENYLQPYKKGSQRLEKPVPAVKKDGIAREIHGAMHATRVSIYVGILDQLIKNTFPAYAEESIRSLETALQLNKASILLLTRYAALCHDAAREGEGFDYWETQSAEVAERFFQENGLNKELAKAFSLLAEYKDDEDKLEEALEKLQFSMPAKAGFNYLRRLVSLADCFDIIRCKATFKFSYIESQLKTIPGFDKEQHSARFFEFAKQVYTLLKAQHDLCRPTQLINSNQEIYPLSAAKNNYSLEEKKKLEHAENVLKSMVNDMRAYPYFSSYLHDELEMATNTPPTDEHEMHDSLKIQSDLYDNPNSKIRLDENDDTPLVAIDVDRHRAPSHPHPVEVADLGNLGSVYNSLPNCKPALPVLIDPQRLRGMLIQTTDSKLQALFSELYAWLDDLKNKGNKFRHSNPNEYTAIDELLRGIDKEMNQAFSIDRPITSNAIRSFCSNSQGLIKEQKTILEKHRGVMGVIDSILTILASLIVFYPAVYLYQRDKGITHTFFNTTSGRIAEHTISTLGKIKDIADDTPAAESLGACSNN